MNFEPDTDGGSDLQARVEAVRERNRQLDMIRRAARAANPHWGQSVPISSVDLPPFYGHSNPQTALRRIAADLRLAATRLDASRSPYERMDECGRLMIYAFILGAFPGEDDTERQWRMAVERALVLKDQGPRFDAAFLAGMKSNLPMRVTVGISDDLLHGGASWLADRIDFTLDSGSSEAHKTHELKVNKKSKSKKARPQQNRQLTDQQNKASCLYEEHAGNVAEVARVMSVSRATAYGHIKAAYRKMGRSLKPISKTRRVPLDMRGQLHLSGDRRRMD